MSKKVWIDTDLGLDDLLAIIYCLKNKDILAISFVDGCLNVDSAYSYTQELLKRINKDVGLYAINKKENHQVFFNPLANYFDIQRETINNNSESLYQKLIKEDSVDLLMLGPHSNIAYMLKHYPEVKNHINRIVMMAGAVYGGNITPSAEYNIYQDIKSADIVFKSGIPITMCDLNVCEKAYFTKDFVDELIKEDSFVGSILSSCEDFLYRHNKDKYIAYDLCASLYLNKEDLFVSEKAFVAVETKGKYTRGQTVTDLYSDWQSEDKNVDIVTDLNKEEYLKEVKRSFDFKL